MTVVEILPHDQAVIDALETLNRPVGFSVAPAGALDAVRDRTGPDYVILYPISGLRDGSAAADEDAELVYQTTLVGRTPEGVRWLIDKVETALAGLTVAGRAVRVTPDEIGPVRPDEDVQPPVFFATPRWRLRTTPA